MHSLLRTQTLSDSNEAGWAPVPPLLLCVCETILKSPFCAFAFVRFVLLCVLCFCVPIAFVRRLGFEEKAAFGLFPVDKVYTIKKLTFVHDEKVMMFSATWFNSRKNPVLGVVLLVYGIIYSALHVAYGFVSFFQVSTFTSRNALDFSGKGVSSKKGVPDPLCGAKSSPISLHFS